MTSIPNRPNAALIVIDMQRGVVADAHTTEDMRQWGSPISADQAIAYTNLYWSFSNAPGRSGSGMPTADIDFSSAR